MSLSLYIYIYNIGDICIHRPTLKDEADEEEWESLHNDVLINILKEQYNKPNSELGWTILLAPSVSHFYQNKKSNEIFQNKYRIERNSKPNSNMLYNDNETCGGSGHYFMNAQSYGGATLGCKPQVCEPARENALLSIHELKLPIAILGGDLMHKQGYGHILTPQETKMKHDCTHWCAPGISDVILSVILSLVDLYDGNHTLFTKQMGLL